MRRVVNLFITLSGLSLYTNFDEFRYRDGTLETVISFFIAREINTIVTEATDNS